MYYERELHRELKGIITADSEWDIDDNAEMGMQCTLKVRMLLDVLRGLVGPETAERLQRQQEQQQRQQRQEQQDIPVTLTCGNKLQQPSLHATFFCSIDGVQTQVTEDILLDNNVRWRRIYELVVLCFYMEPDGHGG
jgi:hypothetical protein